MSIKRFKDIYIDCRENEARIFFKQSLEKLKDPTLIAWNVGCEAMKLIHDDFCFVDGLYSCANYLDATKSPIATITLVYDNERKYIWISNIVPCRIRQFSIDQYNEIFDIYCRDIILPTVKELQLKYRITSETYTAREVMTETTWNELNRFHVTANYTVSHSCDMHHWHRFVISAFKNDRELNSTTLGRILHDELGWSDQDTSHLMMQYEDEIALLHEYTSK